jgi:hypothetical protein
MVQGSNYGDPGFLVEVLGGYFSQALETYDLYPSAFLLGGTEGQRE